MEGSRRRTHQDCPMFKRYLGWQVHSVAFGYNHVFGIATIYKTPNHGALHAKLLISSIAIVALTTAQDIMHTDAVPNLDGLRLIAYLFNDACDLVPQRSGDWRLGRCARSIVCIAMANACGPNAYQNIAIANW